MKVTDFEIAKKLVNQMEDINNRLVNLKAAQNLSYSIDGGRSNSIPPAYHAEFKSMMEEALEKAKADLIRKGNQIGLTFN